MTADLYAAIASAPMFDGLDRAHVDFLAAQSRPIFLPGGQVLFRRGRRLSVRAAADDGCRRGRADRRRCSGGPDSPGEVRDLDLS